MSLTEDHRRREQSVTLASEPGETHELMTLNLGPHHPDVADDRLDVPDDLALERGDQPEHPCVAGITFQ